MRKHLAIMNRPTIEAVLSGKKSVETRFSKHRIVPFGQISVGDLVYMKPPGDEIKGQFRVKKVYSFEGLTQRDVQKLFDEYGKQISIGDKDQDDKYIKEKVVCNFGTLIFISESEQLITSPIKLKKHDQRGWVVLD